MNGIPIAPLIIGAVIMLAVAGLYIFMQKSKGQTVARTIKNTIEQAAPEPEKTSNNGEYAIVNDFDAFPAYVLDESRNALYPCRINKPLGRQIFMPPPMPVTGWHYLVLQQANGAIIDYEPRNATLISDVTPDKAWRATHWDEPQEWFTEPSAIWKDANTWVTIIFGVFSFILWLVCLGA